MTLSDIVNVLKNIAIKQPNINHIGDGDVYQLNSLPNIDYSVFWVTQTNHIQMENTIEYNLTLFYIDRLMTNSDNRLQIQSNGIITIGNILNILKNNYDVEVGDIQYTTFIQRFADECSGVFANVKIIADNNIGLCGYE